MRRPSPDNEQSEVAPIHAGKAVLVVDDEIEVRRFVKNVLERAGLRVLEAEDGLDAVRVLDILKPDLLLTDIVMPRMDGVALAKKVMNELPDVPVLLMSGYISEPGQVMKARAVLRKPFAPAALVETVIRQLRPDR